MEDNRPSELARLLQAKNVLKEFYWGYIQFIYFFFYRLRKWIKTTVKTLRNPKKKKKKKKLLNPYHDISTISTFTEKEGRIKLVKNTRLFQKLEFRDIFFALFNESSLNSVLNGIIKYRYNLNLRINSILLLNGKIVINRNFCTIKRIHQIKYNNLYLKLTQGHAKTRIVEKIIPVDSYIYNETKTTRYLKKTRKYGKRFTTKAKRAIGTFKIIPRLVTINLRGIISFTFLIAFIKWKPVFQTYTLFPMYNFNENFFIQYVEKNRVINNIIEKLNSIDTLKIYKVRLPKIYYWIENKVFILIVLPRIIKNIRFKALLRIILVPIIMGPFKFLGHIFLILKYPSKVIYYIFKNLVYYLCIPLIRTGCKIQTILIYILKYLYNVKKILIRKFYIESFFKQFKHLISYNSYYLSKPILLCFGLYFLIIDLMYTNYIFSPYTTHLGFILYTTVLTLLILVLLYDRFTDYIANNLIFIISFYFFVMFITPKFIYADLITSKYTAIKRHSVKINKLHAERRKLFKNNDPFNPDVYNTNLYHFRKMLKFKITSQYKMMEQKVFSKYYEGVLPPSQLSKKKQHAILELHIDEFFFSLAGIIFIFMVLGLIILCLRRSTTLSEFNESMLNVRKSSQEERRWIPLAIKYPRERNLYRNYMQNIFMLPSHTWRYIYLRAWAEESSNYGYFYASGSAHPTSLDYYVDDHVEIQNMEYFQLKLEKNIKDYKAERQKAFLYSVIDKSLLNYKHKVHPLSKLTMEDIPDFFVWEYEDEAKESDHDAVLQGILFGNEEALRYENKFLFSYMQKNSSYRKVLDHYLSSFSHMDLEDLDLPPASFDYALKKIKTRYSHHAAGRAQEEQKFLVEYHEQYLDMELEVFNEPWNINVRTVPRPIKHMKRKPIRDILRQKEEEMILGNRADLDKIFFYYRFISDINRKEQIHYPWFYELNAFPGDKPIGSYYQPNYKEIRAADDMSIWYLETYLPVKLEQLTIINESTDPLEIEIAENKYEKNEEELEHFASLRLNYQKISLHAQYKANKIFENTII